MSISRRNYEQVDAMKSESREKSTESSDDVDEIYLKKLDPDKFIESYGNYGKYQIWTYILVQTLNFFYSASMYVMSFVQLDLKQNCFLGNDTLKIGHTCNIEEEGGKYGELNGGQCGVVNDTRLVIPKHTAKSNLLIEYSLTCSHWFFQEFGLTIFTIAAVVSVPFMAMLADRYGRKPVIVGSAILAFVANLAASFAPNYAVFLILRAVVGAGSDTYLSVGNVATCEYISEKARAWITVVYNVAWSLGMVWVLLVTQMTDDWRWRYFIVACPGVYAFVLWILLPESPHWLIVKNRTEKLKKYIRTANRINKKTPDLSECQQSAHHQEKHEGFKELLKSKKLIWILFANGFIEMVISLVYFGISFICVEIGDDHFKAFLYSSVIEIPAGLAVLPLMMSMGRKTIVIWCLVLQTLALILVTVFIEIESMKLAMMLAAKVMSTIIYSVHPIWANEQFPTSVRSLCFSLINIPQSLGIMMSPYVKHVTKSPNWIPFTAIALLSFISATLAFMLNETKNAKLPSDVESLSNPGEAADLSEYRSTTSSTASSTKSSTKRTR